jgi:hypothetical protein
MRGCPGRNKIYKNASESFILNTEADRCLLGFIKRVIPSEDLAYRKPQYRIMCFLPTFDGIEDHFVSLILQIKGKT